ncbi:MAG TPA: DUF4112 domain-containing protein [Burkholderiales bacterium]|nr:DUF4112 domain-containing protein [Burkholderiales bacterium]
MSLQELSAAFVCHCIMATLEGEVLGPETPKERETRERLNFIAWLLDSSIPVPRTKWTIGIDALIGLIPFLGDLIGVLLSSYILTEAGRMGVSKTVLARMGFNVAVEGLVGIIPFAGDVFDAAWKANQRNVRLLNEWVERPTKAEKSSRGFLLIVVLGMVLLLVLCMTAAFFLARWLWDLAG